MKFRHLKTKGYAAIRAKLGLSQRHLAEQLGISKAALSMAETGRRNLPTAALLKIGELEKKLAAALDMATEKSHMHLVAEATTECNKLRKEQCDAQIRQLTIKLERMTGRYKKLHTQLQLIDIILENEPDETNKGLILSLQVQRNNIVSKMSKCGPQEQARLRNKIAVLNAEVNMQ